MNLESTLTWPLSCPKDGVHLCFLNGGGGIGHLWLYLVGPLAGGALAAMVFKYQHAES